MGWRDALADPAAAIDALAKRDGMVNKAVEMEKLQWLLKNQIASPQMAREGFGVVDTARLNRQIDTVAQTFALPSRPPLESVYNAGFLPPVGDRRGTAPK